MPSHSDEADAPDVLDAQTPRELDLHKFAVRLTSLARLLDTRENKIRAEEAQLAEQRNTLLRHENTLQLVESNAREQLSDLLGDIGTRQKSLCNRESQLQHAKSVVSSQLSSAQNLLADASMVTRQLPARRAELEDAKRLLEDHNAALADARLALTDAQNRRENALADTQTILDDRRKLRHATERLEQLDAKLNERNAAISRRELDVQSQKASTERFAILERAVAPLQLLLDEFAAVDGTPAPDVSADLPAGIHFVIARLVDARAEARKLADLRATLNTQRVHLDERLRTMRAEDSTFHTRQAALAADQRRLSDRKQAVDRAAAEAEATARIGEDSRAQLESREDALRAREVLLLTAEENAARRESTMANLEQTLGRKERSIARTQASVAAREQTISRRLKEVEMDRAGVECMRKEVEMREGLLHTRDLELSAREARNQTESEAIGNTSLRRASDGTENVPRVTIDPSLHRESVSAMPEVEKRKDSLEKGEASMHGGNDQTDLDPRRVSENPETVRRQLAFESSVKNIPETYSTHGTLGASSQPAHLPPPVTSHHTGPHVPPLVNVDPQLATGWEPSLDSRIRDDTESEAAAEQLLPELLSARSLWKERIVRLEDVVKNMQKHAWAVRPHVQPVLLSVAEALSTMRTEVDSAPVTGTMSLKEQYAAEQQCQVRWSAALREQLDAVRDVQTGVLIGIRDFGPGDDAMDEKVMDSSKDDGVETQTQESGHIDDSESKASSMQRSSTMNQPESSTMNQPESSTAALTRDDNESVEETVDATGALHSEGVYDVTMEVGTKSFLRFRDQLQHSRNEFGDETNTSSQQSFTGAVQGRDRVSSAEQGQVVVRHARDDSLVGELASLQDELKSIIGLRFDT